MNYKNVIQEIFAEYMKALKRDGYVMQKEMAEEIGVSETLISKWKKGERDINGEYYSSIKKYFTKKEFCKCFMKNREKLIERFEGDNQNISQEEFWYKLFEGDFKQYILDKNRKLEILFKVMQIKIKYSGIQKIFLFMNRRESKEEYIEVLLKDKQTCIYWENYNTLILSNYQNRIVIGEQEIKEVKWGDSFIYQLPIEILDTQLIEMNRYADAVLQVINY